MLLFRRRPWEEDKGTRITEGMREEVHRFDEYDYTLDLLTS